jgi:hypothetical protein
MHINLVTTGISEQKITLPCVSAGSLAVTARGKEFAELRYKTVGDGDVEVVMGSGLFAQQSVHSPATIHIYLQTVLLQKRYDLRGITSIHGFSLHRELGKALSNLY